MGTTTNLGLSTYNLASGSVTTFQDFRLATNGDFSNMTIIDSFAGTINTSINALKNYSTYDVSANQILTNYYEATVPAITSYATNMKIELKLNSTISGSVSLNINGFGIKSLKKINNSGTIIDLTTNDLLINNYYPFIYNGTYFLSMGTALNSSGSGTTNDQPFVTSASTSGLTNYRVLTAGSNITIQDIGRSLIITATSGSVISSITGSGVMSSTTASTVKHDISGIISGSYNQVMVDQYGHVTAGNFINIYSGSGTTNDQPFVTSASTSGLTNYRVLTAGSNITIQNINGSLIINATSGSVSGSVISSITGSGVMSSTTGSIVNHDVSGIISGSYNQIIVDQYGHVTAGSIINNNSGSGAYVYRAGDTMTGDLVVPSIFLSNGTTSTPSVSFSQDPNSGLELFDSSVIAFVVGSQAGLLLSGQSGIGLLAIGYVKPTATRFLIIRQDASDYIRVSAGDNETGDVLTLTNAGNLILGGNITVSGSIISGSSPGINATKTFYSASASGGAVTHLNTVTIKNGLITEWV